MCGLLLMFPKIYVGLFLSFIRFNLVLSFLPWQIYNYQVVNEDYNVVNTPLPNGINGYQSLSTWLFFFSPLSNFNFLSWSDLVEMVAATPAPVQNDNGDDDDDEPLNEADDDDDLDDVGQGEDLNTNHLVLAQFDKVLFWSFVFYPSLYDFL